MTGNPKRVRTTTTRSGVSRPWSCIRSGLSASMIAASWSSPASTESATLSALPRTRSPSTRAASKPTLRGEGGKNTKPTMSAPASSATSRASGVFRPQILIKTGMRRFYIGTDGLSRSSRRLRLEENGSRRRGRDGELGRIVRPHRLGRKLGRSRAPLEAIDLRAQLACLRLREPCGAAPFALPEPGSDPTNDHAANEQEQDQREQRQLPRENRVRLVEGVERDDHQLPVRHREGDENDRERHQDQRRDNLANHGLRRWGD